MALYEIIIGNQADDRTYSKLVLSEEPLDDTIEHIDNIADLDDYFGEYVISVQIPSISINSYTNEEYYRLLTIKNQLT